MATSRLPDFDALLMLAKDNPSHLDHLKEYMINEAIEHAPNFIRNRLQGLQFQVDMQLKTTSNPIAGCVVISRLMHESLDDMSEAIKNPTSLLDHNRDKAQVLDFKSSSTYASRTDH